MFRSSLAILFLGSVALAGCRSGSNNNNNDDLSGGSHDLKVNGDGSAGNGDMTVLSNYTETTPHAIDVGDTQVNTSVKLLGMVVTTPVYSFKNSAKTQCQYEMWVQDPTCGTTAAAPCGIVVEDPTKYDLVSGKCPFVDSSTSPLKTVMLGDNVDVYGIVDTFPDNAPVTGFPAVVQHSVQVQQLNSAAGSATVTPITLTSTDDLTAFNNRHGVMGKGYFKYEGTLVKLAPASGKLTITQVIDFTTGSKIHTYSAGLGNSLTAMDISIGDDFSFSWNPKQDGGFVDFPVLNQTFTSIQGVVDNIFGGQLQPVLPGDWVK